MFETLTLSTDLRGVARLVLNRPDKHNAMSGAMIAELTQAARQLAADPTVRMVVLTGAGPSFCAGADLGWMRAQVLADDATRGSEATRLADMLRALNDLPKPVIGRVQGNAFGGGVGLLAVCDVVIAASVARFGLTETRLGLIPATIGPYVLARIGEAAARRVMLSARILDAQEALRSGLVAQVVAPGDLDAAVEAEVAAGLACAPGAVAATKAMIRALGPVIDDATIAASVAALIRQWQSPEATEGIAAFFDRRKPDWDRTGT